MSTYDDVKKAYSIWICMNPPKSHSNVAIPEGCIVRYDPVPTVIHSQGDPKDIAFGVYDLWSVIIITLVADPQKTDNELIGMLSTLLSKTTDAQTKMRKLATEYGIPLTRETSNLSEGLIEDAIEQVQGMYMDKLAQKDAALSEKDAALSEKDAALSEKDARIAELEKQNSGLLTEGKISTILELIASGIITLQQGAAQLSISEAEMAKMVAAWQ